MEELQLIRRYVLGVSTNIMSRWYSICYVMFNRIAKNKAKGVWHTQGRNAFLVQSELAMLGSTCAYSTILQMWVGRNVF